MKNIDEILEKCIQTNSKKTKEKLLDNYCDFCMKQISLETDKDCLKIMLFNNKITENDFEYYNKKIDKKLKDLLNGNF